MFPPPPVAGHRHDRRLQAADRGSRRARLRGARRGHQGVPRARRAQTPELAGMFSGYQVNVPQLYADIDRVKARQLGVAVTDVFDTMQIYLGSLYVNDFNKFGRTYSVRVQADAKFRARADDVGPAQGALGERRDDPARRRCCKVKAERGAGARAALQRLPRRRHQRRRGAGLLVGSGAGRDRAYRGRDAAERLRVRVDRPHLSGDPRRQFGGDRCFRSRSCWYFSCWPRCTRA